MGPYVHRDLTRRWALEEGFSAQDAETIAEWNLHTDSAFNPRVWRHKRYHAAALGAHLIADAYLARALAERSLPHLGIALHAEQDAISHGRLGHIFHYPGIDDWSRRSERVRERIEKASRDCLRAYRADGGQPPVSRAASDAGGAREGRLRETLLETPLEPPESRSDPARKSRRPKS